MSPPIGPRVLVVIPARGGSKGIPRKNLRALRGKPLISYSIATALASRHSPMVLVTSDDEEILAVAASLGALVHRRPQNLADDSTTLDAVVFDAMQAANARDMAPDIVVTLQPTSPLLRTASLDTAIDQLTSEPELDAILSATDATHLTWTARNGNYIPLYQERLNRQYLPKMYRETGGFLIARSASVTPESRLGPRVSLYVLEGPEAIDIDTLQDLNLCEWYLGRRHVVLVASGHASIGLGHVYNLLTIAGDLTRHLLTFVVDSASDLAYDVLSSHNYPVVRQSSRDLADDVIQLAPDVVINDILDTTADYVSALRQAGARIINFEDLGEGARDADLVINAIYPEREILPAHYFGARYFSARPEFLAGPPSEVRDVVRSVLITFGGTDPNNLSAKTLEAIHGYCQDRGIGIHVVTGPGYSHEGSLEPHPGVTVASQVKNISEYMRATDVIFTSAGRTVFEVACVGTPAILLAQNDRELTHFFASKEHGFLNLGLGVQVPHATLLHQFRSIVESVAMRRRMRDLMLETDLRSGKERVMRLIDEVIGN